MNTTNHASPSGEDAANGAIGEREAFEALMRMRGEDYLYRRDVPGCERHGDYCRQNVQDQWEVWQARAALTAEKVAAEPVATLHDDGHFTWHGAKPHDFNYAGWRMKVYAAPQPAQTQVALTDDARDCLADVVSHYRALYAGLAFQLNEATVTENADDMAYWKHEIKALERMYAQAERALLAAQPVSGGKL